MAVLKETKENKLPYDPTVLPQDVYLKEQKGLKHIFVHICSWWHCLQ